MTIADLVVSKIVSSQLMVTPMMNSIDAIFGRKSLPVLFAVWGALLWANPSSGSLLVGTVVTSEVETIPEINQLIADYNADFGASLPSVVALLDKIEGQTAADFTEGNLALSDFDFHHQDNSGTTSVNIFDATVNFTASTLGVAAGFDTLDNPVFAFEQLSGPSFEYYVSKDGSLGWSLWAYMSGINPAYTDRANGGFTRGGISDNSLDYDPITRAVSHISFYTADSVVPEPGSLILLSIAASGLAGCRLRRRCVA
jgi:hypothetical protein